MAIHSSAYSITLQEIALGERPNTGCANGFTFFTFMRNKKPPMKPPLLVWLQKHSIKVAGRS